MCHLLTPCVAFMSPCYTFSKYQTIPLFAQCRFSFVKTCQELGCESSDFKQALYTWRKYKSTESLLDLYERADLHSPSGGAHNTGPKLRMLKKLMAFYHQKQKQWDNEAVRELPPDPHTVDPAPLALVDGSEEASQPPLIAVPITDEVVTVNNALSTQPTPPPSLPSVEPSPMIPKRDARSMVPESIPLAQDPANASSPLALSLTPSANKRARKGREWTNGIVFALDDVHFPVMMMMARLNEEDPKYLDCMARAMLNKTTIDVCKALVQNVFQHTLDDDLPVLPHHFGKSTQILCVTYSHLL